MGATDDDVTIALNVTTDISPRSSIWCRNRRSGSPIPNGLGMPHAALLTVLLVSAILCSLPVVLSTAESPPLANGTNATSGVRPPSSSQPWTDTSGPQRDRGSSAPKQPQPYSYLYDGPGSSSASAAATTSPPPSSAGAAAGSPLDASRLAGQWQAAAAKVGQHLMDRGFAAPRDTLCFRHTETFIREVRNLEPWALHMLDASSKMPSGLLQGNTAWWGNYAECLDVDVHDPSETTHPATATPSTFSHIHGQYCTVSVRLDAVKMRNNATETILVRLGLLDEMSAAGSDLSVSLGLCVPSSCSTLDTQINVQSILDWMQVPVIATTQSCQNNNSYQLDTVAYVVICAWSIFCLLIALGTAYEAAKSMLSSCRCRDRVKSTTSDHANSMDPLAAHCNSSNSSNSSEKLSTHGKLGKFLLCFSAISNVRQLLNVGQTQAEHMSTLHGVRVLSMSWIILGHTYFVGMISGPLWDNSKDFLSLPANFAFQGVLRGIFSVDTFLFLSGLLVVHVTLKKIKATDGKFNIFAFYLHRIIRIVPVYLMAIAWVAGPSDYVLAGGPLWPQMVQAKNNCQETWWKNLLFISNFGDTTKMCIQHSWYISLDTQLYAISPLLVYPMYKSPRLGVILTVLCMVASCTAAGVISYTLGLPSSSLLHTMPVDTLIAYAKEFYIKPYCRMGPYAVGMLCGYLLLNVDLKTKIKPPLSYLLWVVALVTNLSILYGTYGQFITETAPSVLQSAIYNGLSGTVWSIGIGWLVCACVSGHGGVVNSILSWKAWVPLSRLTYCAYLLHMIVQYTFFDSRQNKFHFDHLLMVTLFAGFLLVTFGAAFLFSIAFEAPIIRLEKLATSGDEQKPTKNGSTNL